MSAFNETHLVRPHQRREETEESTLEPPRKLPPSWIFRAVWTVIVSVASAVAGAMGYTWKVRGACDDIDARLRVHEVRFDAIDKGLVDLRQDVRDLRQELRR